MAKGTCCFCCSVIALLGMAFYAVLALLASAGNEPFLVIKATGVENKEVTETNLWTASGVRHFSYLCLSLVKSAFEHVLTLFNLL